MDTGEVVHLFEGHRGNRPQKIRHGVVQGLLVSAWRRVATFVVAVVEVARESRELEKHVFNQRGYRRFLDY